MITWLLSLFGCRHRNISRVFMDRRTGRNYVACMDCCQRYWYDWDAMKQGERIDAPRKTPLVHCPVEEARRAL